VKKSSGLGMVIALLGFLLGSGAALAAPENPCEEGALVFGMSTALSGPAARLGLEMRQGVLAAFAEANRAGGIHGASLCLVALDDGYEPARTVPNMHALIEKEQVLAVVGNVGTPTAVVASPIATRFRTLFYGAFTGAGLLRKTPPDRYVVNYRASYAEETEAMVDALVLHGGVRPEEIAFFTQRDAFGDAGFSGGLRALRRHGLKDVRRVAHGRYERNTVAIENGLATVLMAPTPARAVIMVGAYSPCAAFVRLAKASGLAARFLTVSFVGAAPLAEELGRDGEGVIVTQVVPHYDADLAVVRRFRQALARLDPAGKPSFGALEGYIASRILLTAMQAMPGKPEREGIVAALERLGRFDIGLGSPLMLGPRQHQASHTVWPTVIRAGKVVPFSWPELARP